MDTAYQDMRLLIEKNRDKVQAIAQGLLKFETLDVAEIEKLLRGEPLDKTSVNDLLDRERAKNAPAIPPKASSQPGVEHSPGAGAIPAPQ